MARNVDSAKVRLWQQRLERFQRSGLSVQKFCDLHKLPVYSFQYWARRLRKGLPVQHDRDTSRQRDAQPRAMHGRKAMAKRGLVAGQAGIAKQAEVAAGADSESQVTICIGSQVSIRVPVDQEQTLARVLQIAIHGAAASDVFQPVLIQG